MSLSKGALGKLSVGTIIAGIVIVALVIGALVLIILGATGLMNNNIPFYPDLEIQDMSCSKCSMSLSGLSLKYDVNARVWVRIKNNKLKRQIIIKDFDSVVNWSGKELGQVGKVSLCPPSVRKSVRLPLTVKSKGEAVMCLDFKGSMSVGITDAKDAMVAYCHNTMRIQATGKAKVVFGKLKNLVAPFTYTFNVQPNKCKCDVASLVC